MEVVLLLVLDSCIAVVAHSRDRKLSSHCTGYPGEPKGITSQILA